MTALIEQELTELFFMFYCGLSVMILFAGRDGLLARCRGRKALSAALYLGAWVCAAFLFYRFLYRASWGVVSIYGLLAMSAGILLWKKVICGILLPAQKAEHEGGREEEH